ncbi:MAG: hypothetical protein H8E15_03640 [Planctomycetes bacterium]|nr:hypothetical protein [Planctomycetota bacterium]
MDRSVLSLNDVDIAFAIRCGDAIAFEWFTAPAAAHNGHAAAEFGVGQFGIKRG